MEDKMQHCDVCGDIDEFYDEGKGVQHESTVKHKCNLRLNEYNDKKKQVTKYGEAVSLVCVAECLPCGDLPGEIQKPCEHFKIRICMRPGQEVKFTFNLKNGMKDEDLLFIGVQLAHPQPQFKLKFEEKNYDFDKEPTIIKRKSSINNGITVSFTTNDVGQYEMPIMFTFHRTKIEKNFVFVRDMVVLVQNESGVNPYPKTPFTNKDWLPTSRTELPTDYLFPVYRFNIPKLLKILFTWNLNENQIEKSFYSDNDKDQLRKEFLNVKSILDDGIVKDNYIDFFHHLLYWEETKARISLRKYNMFEVTISKQKNGFWLEVPGLAEKRPSLLRGDIICIRPHAQDKQDAAILFQGIITEIKENTVNIGNLHHSFNTYYNPTALYDIRFLMSRVPVERMHEAVSKVFSSRQDSRIFPVPAPYEVSVHRIKKFYNKIIKSNEEQRSAVDHIVSGSSGKAPYIVFGPPGTGKTMTIVEAIIQTVVRVPQSRVLVCTDSNMAADHIAVMLMKYNHKLNINRFLLRASSRNREWTILPAELHSVSNGTSYKSFFSVSNDYARSHRILVTTLLHAAQYGITRNGQEKVQVSHLFIDEAAQAMEPAALVPISGLLKPDGQLVLAGDPMQLGPVCLSRRARDHGLGISLLERLWKTYSNLYGDNKPNYATILVNNFRSHPDILMIPNEFFYTTKPLQPKAELDSLSTVSVLGNESGKRALVFHSVNSREQRNGKAPSFFNDMELKLLQTYIKALTGNHGVSPKDIGIITPYIRQVYKMKDWLTNNDYLDVEVGSVEAFQGKEKRVILLSTVRANCRLLDYDAKYNLGFVGEGKRFNVALTRAKAKIIVIGNPACLIRCEYWRKYMDVSKEIVSYLGHASEQLERTSAMLLEVTEKRFARCRLDEVLKETCRHDKNEPKKPN